MSGANSETIQQGTNYFRIIGGCFLLAALREQAVSSLQGMKDFDSPKRSGFWMSVGHLALTVPIIYLFHLSLVYVAWATVMSEVIGLSLLLHPLKKQAFPNEIPWKWNKTILHAMFRLSKFVMVQSIFTRVSLMLYFGMFFSYGTEAYAAMRFQAQVASLTYAVADAFIAILNPLCSKLYGERTFLDKELEAQKKMKQDQTVIQELKNNRNKKDQKLLGLINWGISLACLFVGVLSLIFYLAGEWIAGLYTNDPTTIQLVQIIFLASFPAEVFFTWYYLLNRSALAAVEDRKGSMISVMIATGVWMIAILIIQKADLGLTALLVSRLLFEILRGSLLARRFYSKHWSRPVE
jgi:Na+-driven multidrug efflux pump